MNKSNTFGIILAAGSGERLKAKRPKQFQLINKKPIYHYILENLNSNKEIDTIIFVTAERWFKRIKNYVERSTSTKKPFHLVQGGSTRQKSAMNGIQYIIQNLKYTQESIIAIFEAARPMTKVSTTMPLAKKIIRSKEADAVAYAIHAEDLAESFLVDDDNYVKEFLDRRSLYILQMPEVISAKAASLIMEIKESDKSRWTSIIKPLFENGLRVKIVKGSKLDIKLTTQDDLSILRGLLKNT